MRTLAHECGVEVPEERGEREERGLSERIFAANEIAQVFPLLPNPIHTRG